ncbi:UDP-N-acetylmuramoyl-L-alanine--D-glutamate ligase [Paenibacillus allorhizosphaerae]|uniref:UDP-N-acetylmuramoylalanine--D-glutamate ligase n=1 Tax=Paenibacillus allorhizosphaerae TaxID=2849866 RepID=A0ABM8VPF4_9BACL|nr:UDP-N-acetylmuramoyl-L-alanine--D-glutamate ligase [Paenibacillus allorhizosphaerae]CAG7652515.1 UDP-N-acetylmuramoylalanine--D-glutamate ligase [Paenibacillus allorhizosphaerae]
MNPAFDTYIQSLAGREVTVIGAGVSNAPLIRMLCSAGARVTVRDRNPALPREEWDDLGVELHLGENYLDRVGGDMVFRTPGMRPDHPALDSARAGGSRVTSEMEEFFALCPCPIFGVTGSDGKTTTTSLIADMLANGGCTVHLGGNIGTPLLTRAGEMSPRDACAVELSSFQLMDMTRSPHVAVITNLSPNHLDWHRDMDEYIAAKRRLLDFQWAGELAVLNGDNPATAAMCGRGRTKYFSRHMVRYDMIDGLVPIRDIRLPGWYNVENVMAAMTAVRGIVPDEAILETVRTFVGVEHRNQWVTTVGGVHYYNNSIGSSPARTIATLHAHVGRVLLIAGGRDKKVPFDEMARLLPNHVKVLLLIGEAASQIEAAARRVPSCPPIVRCEGLAEAVVQAHKLAVQGDTVLLSPACTAYDQYSNFEERGRHFVELVGALQRSEGKD